MAQETDPMLEYESSDTGLEVREKLNQNLARRHWRVVNTVGFVAMPYTLADGVEYVQIDISGADGTQTMYLPNAANYAGRVLWVEVTTAGEALNIYANGTQTINGLPHICISDYNSLIVLSAVRVDAWTAWKMPRYSVTAPPGATQVTAAAAFSISPTFGQAGTTIT